MNTLMEITPRSHINLSEVLPNLRHQASPRATAAEIISSRLGIKLTGMTLNGETLHIFGEELTELEKLAKESGQKPRDFILSKLSA